jgi:isopenicillin N synthase-like dioxygenase
VTAGRDVPVIDLGGVPAGGGGEALMAVGRRIADACRETGFFYSLDRGVPDGVVEDVFDANRSFHPRPDAEMLPLRLDNWHRDDQANGWTPTIPTAFPPTDPAGPRGFRGASMPRRHGRRWPRRVMGDGDPLSPAIPSLRQP